MLSDLLKDHRVVVVILLVAVMALFSLRAQAEQNGGGSARYPYHLQSGGGSTKYPYHLQRGTNQSGGGGAPFHMPIPSCSP